MYIFMSWYKQTGTYRNTFHNQPLKNAMYSKMQLGFLSDFIFIINSFSFCIVFTFFFEMLKITFGEKTVRKGKHHSFIENVYMAEWIDGPSTALICSQKSLR